MSEWINVKDELPEIREAVLMRVLLRLSSGDSFNVEEGYYKGNDEWVSCWCSSRNKDTYPVKHWMPLPKPPTGEE